MSRQLATYGARSITTAAGQIPSSFPRTIGPNAMTYLQEVVDSGLTSNMVDRFEQAFAAALGVKHCIATPGCTPALAVLAAAFDFEPGDEIIVSPVTDFGTVQGLINENLIPVFPDTEPGTVDMSAATIEPLIGPRTRAILTVHMTGIICDMDPILRLAKKQGLLVYEDACQSVFGEYKGRLAGTIGTAGAFSFDAEKTMGSDVGGCLVTDDDALAETARYVGQARGGEMVPPFGRVHTHNGYAYRMTSSTAAITLAQLEIIRPQVEQRDRMIRLLSEKLEAVPGVAPLPIPDYLDVYSCWMVGMSLDPGAFTCSADDFAAEMLEAGIPNVGTARYYLMPAGLKYLQEKAANGVYPYSQPPASRAYDYGADSCPTARDFLERFIRWSSFSEKYQDRHCELIAEIVADIADRHRA